MTWFEEWTGLEYVTIKATDDAHAHAQGINPGPLAAQHGKWRLAQLKVALAGGMAEALYWGTEGDRIGIEHPDSELARYSIEAADDLATAVSIAKAMKVASPPEFVERCAKVVRQDLENPTVEAAIRQIAAALLDQETLNADEVEQAIRRSLEPGDS